MIETNTEKKKGIITPNGVSLEKHENDTIVFFTDLGKDIELIPPSNTPCSRRPDFWMDSLEWEMKSPEQSKREVIERAFDKALRQSCNVVIDLRRIKGKEGRRSDLCGDAFLCRGVQKDCLL